MIRELITMRIIGHLVCILLLLCLSGCAPPGTKLNSVAKDCDVSWIEHSQLPAQKACELRALARRCAVSDRCQIQCEAKGGLPNIGGGCSHVCQGGGAAQTDEDIAKNGGLYSTEESIACYNQSRQQL